MRVSTDRQFDSYKTAIDRASSRVFDAQRKVSSGRRIDRPSDDSRGVSASISMRNLKAGLEQYQRNLGEARGYLGYTESALGEVSTLMSRAYELSVRGASGSTDQLAREAMATEINEIQRRLIDLGNAQGPSGQFLFGGQRNNIKPFTTDSNGIVFNGDSQSIVIETGPVDVMPVNVAGQSLFTEAYNRLETLKTNLLGGNVSAISSVDLPALQDSVKTFNFTRGTVGSRLKAVDEQTVHHTRRTDDLTASISKIEDVDIAEAIVDYQLAQTAYQAALNVASQGFRLSLMDFIRG